RLMALIGGVEILVAFLYMHVGLLNAQKTVMVFWPWANGGELALMYFAAFLVLFTQGSGKWNLEKSVKKQ
ncbi:MAG: hypothetical protein Q7S65_01195, partial [Nanoarchaeota archaeon]|nr:hypothetical protein [Nanoarchaeota archaeon]